MNVYTIVVLTSGDKHKTDISINDFRPRKLDGSYIPETQHKIIYLCPKYATDKTPEPYREWLRAIDDSLDQQVEEDDYDNETIQEIFSLIKEDKISPQEAFKMKDEYSDEQYLRDERKEAIEKGRETEKKENAKAMIKEGMDFLLISKITGISKEKLHDLEN